LGQNGRNGDYFQSRQAVTDSIFEPGTFRIQKPMSFGNTKGFDIHPIPLQASSQCSTPLYWRVLSSKRWIWNFRHSDQSWLQFHARCTRRNHKHITLCMSTIIIQGKQTQVTIDTACNVVHCTTFTERFITS